MEETDTQMEKEIERELRKKKWHHLKDLSSHCFLLSGVMLLCFTVAAFMLMASCVATFGEDNPRKYDLNSVMKGSGEEKDNAILLLCLTILSVIAAIVSFLLMLSTYDKNMWLALPFILMLVALMMFYLYQLMQLGLCIGTCNAPMNFVAVDPNATAKSEFAQNILRGGGIYVFSSMTVLGFLLYAILPVFKFFLECYRQRLERQRREARRASLHPPPPVAAPPPAEPAPEHHHHHRHSHNEDKSPEVAPMASGGS